ncbi:uncharacterized protein LOC133338624 [Musca vetustissima]|uniref:uncharacterized protein LOC133338624 n=1 Tax=Musca vetustissima TaxID=27455 RepID=UPI002AB6C2D8|nr:uncharacterized protein LOC133338624 [Musca vetustissima]
MSGVFGEEFKQNWPLISINLKLSKFGQKLIEKIRSIEKAQTTNIDVAEFIKKSYDFPIDFPIQSCRVKSQPQEHYPIIKQQIASAYPVIHEKVIILIIDFLEHKLKYVSSYSDFINDGKRTKTKGEGIVMGIIGARLERQGVMEFQDIIISENQNILKNGYGPKSIEIKAPKKSLLKMLNLRKRNALKKLQDYRRIWNKFYEENDHLHEDVVKENNNPRYGNSLNSLLKVDYLIMKKRYAIAIDMLLLESDNRAKLAGKLAYIHMEDFWICGVWLAEHQESIFVETISQRLKYLLPYLNNIGVVHLGCFNSNEWGDLKNGGIFKSDYHPRGGIKTIISNQPPDYDNMLLIVTYAWNANALPGNEFWMRKLEDSNDASTACSTLISELHNPHINTEFVCGNNLHVACADYGILHINDYVDKCLSSNI